MKHVAREVDAARDCLALRPMLELAHDDRRIDRATLAEHLDRCDRCAAAAPELVCLLATRPADPVRAPGILRPRGGSPRALRVAGVAAAVFAAVVFGLRNRSADRDELVPTTPAALAAVGRPVESAIAASASTITFDRAQRLESTVVGGRADGSLRKLNWEAP